MIYVHRDSGLAVAPVGVSKEGARVWRTAPRTSTHQWAEFEVEPDADMVLVFKAAFLAIRGTG